MIDKHNRINCVNYFNFSFILYFTIYFLLFSYLDIHMKIVVSAWQL